MNLLTDKLSLEDVDRMVASLRSAPRESLERVAVLASAQAIMAEALYRDDETRIASAVSLLDQALSSINDIGDEDATEARKGGKQR